MDVFLENNQLQEKREAYNNLQQEKTIEATSDTAIPETLNEFKQKADESRLNKGELKNRTDYYFKDSELMQAKATRYRNMAGDKNGMESYAARYTNKTAKKRKRAANKAANKFAEAARLENRHAAELNGAEETINFALFQHREEVIRKRLEGMEYAAEAKSKSDEEEVYRKLKARHTCLMALLEQIYSMNKEQLTAKDKRKFVSAFKRIKSEMDQVEDKLSTVIPLAVKERKDRKHLEKKETQRTAEKITKVSDRISRERFDRMKGAVQKLPVGTDMETFHDLSVFLTGNELEDNAILKAYLGSEKNPENGEIEGINKNKAMLLIADKLLSVDLNGIDFSDDEKMAESAEKLEQIAGYVSGYERLLEKTPGFLDSLSEGRRNELQNIVDNLRAVGAYYSSRKEVLNDMQHRFNYNNKFSEYDFTDEDDIEIQEIGNKQIRSFVYSKQLKGITGITMPKLKRLKLQSQLSKEVLEIHEGSNVKEQMSLHLRHAHKSADYLAGGIHLDPYMLDHGPGERYKLHTFMGFPPASIEDDPEMLPLGETVFKEQKRKFQDNQKNTKRADLQKIKDAINTKYPGRLTKEINNDEKGIKFDSISINRFLMNLTSNNTAHLSTDQVVDMLSKILSGNGKEFIEGIKAYKKIILDTMRSFVGTMGNLFTQVPPEELKSILCNYGDILKEYMLVLQDANILLNHEKKNEYLDLENNEEDKEFKFLSDYMRFVVQNNSIAYLDAISNRNGKLPDYMSSVNEMIQKSANGEGIEFFAGDIENNKYMRGPSQSALYQQTYSYHVKKIFTDEKYTQFKKMRSVFVNVNMIPNLMEEGEEKEVIKNEEVVDSVDFLLDIRKGEFNTNADNTADFFEDIKEEVINTNDENAMEFLEDDEINEFLNKEKGNQEQQKK